MYKRVFLLYLFPFIVSFTCYASPSILDSDVQHISYPESMTVANRALYSPESEKSIRNEFVTHRNITNFSSTRNTALITDGSYKHNVIIGVYYGFLIAIIICNLYFYIRFTEKVYLYYVAFLFLYSLAILYHDGFMNIILPATISFDFEAIFHLLTGITMFLFSVVFLELNTHVPKFRKYAIGLVVSMVLAALMYMISAKFIFYVITDLIAMSSFIIIWVLNIVYMRKVKFTKFHILGYFTLITFGIHFLFSYDFGIMPGNGRIIFLKMTSTIGMFIFTYAISHRLDILNKKHKNLIVELRALLSVTTKKTQIDFFYSLLEENTLTNKTLTVQEIKVLKCIHNGMSNSEIADKLFVSYNTIKFHVRNIYQKLNVSSRQEANEKLLKYKGV